MQNLGYFPVKGLQLNIDVPEMTRNGNQLLQISDFYIDQVSVPSTSRFTVFVRLLTAAVSPPERRLPLFAHPAHRTEPRLARGPVALLPLGEVHTGRICSHSAARHRTRCLTALVLFTQNRSNTLSLPVQCSVNVASHRETAVRMAGTLRVDTLHAVSLRGRTRRCSVLTLHR